VVCSVIGGQRHIRCSSASPALDKPYLQEHAHAPASFGDAGESQWTGRNSRLTLNNRKVIFFLLAFHMRDKMLVRALIFLLWVIYFFNGSHH
jgi:hypothetical protein